MKKNIFIVLYILLVIFCGRQVINYLYNQHVINEYLAGNYTINEDLLLSLNIIEPYIPYYNNGNILYNNHLYEEAIEAYEDALSCPGIPERRECSIRINLALAKIALLPDPYDSKTHVNESLDILRDARSVLIEGGCATDDGDGHSIRAERLKREIDSMIEYLENKQTGTLEIRKTITGVDDVHNLSQISFTVTGPEEFSPITVIFDPDSNLWIQDGDTYTITIDDIPLGEYTVTENENGATDEWLCSTDNGYQVSVEVIAVTPIPADITNEYSAAPDQPQETGQSGQSGQSGESGESGQSGESDETGESGDPGTGSYSYDPSGVSNPNPTNDTGTSDQSGAGTVRPTTFEEYEEEIQASMESIQNEADARRQLELERIEAEGNSNSEYEGIW